MEFWSLAPAIALPVGGSIALSFFTPPPDDWYRSLNKPPWTPPGWAFPLVWTTLYLLMGIASWLVWRQGGFEKQWLPLLIYLIQLIFNFAWTPLFFGLHRIDFALIDIALLWLGVLATMIAFWPVNKWAGLMIVPYILWVSIAAWLNYYMFANNAIGRGYPDELTRPLDTQ